MKTLLGIAIGIITMVGIRAAADTIEVDNGIRFLRSSFDAGWVSIESFEDTRTGIVCYVADGGNGKGISCVKK